MADPKVKESPVQPADAPPSGEPQVLADSGHFLIKVTDPFVTAFDGHYPDGDNPETPVTVTRDGLQVTKAQGQHLQLQAAEHGVSTSLERVNDGGR